MKQTVTALGIIIIIGVGYLGWKHSNVHKVLSFISSDMETEGEIEAASVEKAFQDLPEPPHPTTALKIPIFIYHHVRPFVKGESARQDQFDVSPEFFEQQLTYLKNNGYTTISLDDLVRDIAKGSTSPVAKPVILTFDDGWRNQYDYAFPLLKKYGMTATFYVYTDPIGKRVYLTWPELKEMDAAGMTIADHTLTHPYFKTLSVDKIQKEITESKKVLEQQLGKPVIHFASPYGYTNNEIMQLVKNAGYVTARTTYKGIYHTKDSLLQLHGILVSDNMSDFIRELTRP